jgi:DnaJ-class molecular chaperone
LYDLLGLDRNCSAADVKKAYRSMALKHHPDRGGDAEKVGGMLHKV